MKLTRAFEQIFTGGAVALLAGIFTVAVKTHDSVVRIEAREAIRDKREDLVDTRFGTVDARFDRIELMCHLKPLQEGEIPWRESKKQKRL